MNSQKIAEEAFKVSVQAIINHFIYTKMPPHPKNSMNKAYLENKTYEQIVSNLEMELEVNGLEAPDELLINIVTQHATKPNPEEMKPTLYHCKKPKHYRNQCRQLITEKDQGESNNIRAGSNKNEDNSGKPNSNSKKTSNKNDTTQITTQTTEMTKNWNFSTQLVGPVAKPTTAQREAFLGANVAIRPSPLNRGLKIQSQNQRQDTQNNKKGIF